MRVLAVKGSGGDLGSIKESGFALVYLDRLEQLKSLYRGEAFEDEMVRYYPLSHLARIGLRHRSILRSMRFFLFRTWIICIRIGRSQLPQVLTAKQKLEEFNKKFGRKIVWLPWQRPGFDLGLQLRTALMKAPGCDGVLLGSHGLFTWGNTQRECYLNSIRTIDEMGEFILQHEAGKQAPFGGVDSRTSARPALRRDKNSTSLRGLVSSNRRAIAHYSDDQDALTFAGSKWCGRA